jgi:hypothetical protein
MTNFLGIGQFLVLWFIKKHKIKHCTIGIILSNLYQHNFYDGHYLIEQKSYGFLHLSIFNTYGEIHMNYLNKEI